MTTGRGSNCQGVISDKWKIRMVTAIGGNCHITYILTESIIKSYLFNQLKNIIILFF